MKARKASKRKPPSLPSYDIETWPISRLKPYARNAMLHPPEQIEELRASLREYGQVWPLLVRASGVIIAGHGRLEAAKFEGMSRVRVIVARGWTEAQCRAFALLDNQIPRNAKWSDELLTLELGDLHASGTDIGDLGFSKKDLARLLPDADRPAPVALTIENAFQVLIECADEAEQLRILTKLQKDGIPCRALIA